MGFYSFYKIIKDIIRTIFGNKFLKLVLILLIIMLVLSFFSNSFASYDVTLDNDVYKLHDEFGQHEYRLFVIFQNPSTNHYFYRMFSSDNPLVSNVRDTSDGGINFSISTEGVLYKFDWDRDYEVFDFTTLGYDMQQLSDGKSATIFNGPCEIISYYSTHDIQDKNGDPVFVANGSAEPSFRNPSIANTDDELSSGNFDSVLINNGDYNYDGNYFYFHVAKVEELASGSGVPYYVDEKVFALDRNSEYFLQGDGFYGYSIPIKKIFAFENNKKYILLLSSSAGSISTLTEDLIFDKKEFTVSEKPIEEVINDNQDITNDKLDEQTNAIKNQTDVIQNQTNVIQNQTDVIQNTSDQLFSNEYDESQINISTEQSDNIDSSSITNFVTTLLQNIQNIATGDWNSVETVSIPLGFVDENIEFRSDLISSHIPQALKIIINLFWMYLFGMYIFKYTSKLIDWLKSGDILNNKEMGANEVITSSML